jgi:negative regulator of flagellin synthesis FlgM
MTDPISPSPRPLPAYNGTRKSADKTGGSEKSASLANTAPAATPGVAPPPAAMNTDSADEINLRKVAQRMHEEPNFDRKKVDSIRKAIQDGQYPLDPRRIAESFLAIEQMIKS